MRRKLLFSFFFLIFSFPVFSVKDFGGLWVDTLNISHHRGLPSPLKSGASGNISDLEGKPYDVDEINNKLKSYVDEVKNSRAVGESHNIIIGGVTLIFRFGDKYEAIYGNIDAGKITKPELLTFVSGTMERKYPNIKSNKPEDPKKEYRIISASQENPPRLLLERFGDRISRGGFPAVEVAYKMWGLDDSEATLVTAKNELQKILRKPHASVALLKIETDELLDRFIKNDKRNYGSAADSEQYFLKYMSVEEEGALNSVSYIMNKYNSLISKYKEKKLANFREKLSKEVANKSMEEIKESFKELTTEIENYQKIIEIGCILHLHSTNEVCQGCACSLAQELRYGEEFNKLRGVMKAHNAYHEELKGYDPFLHIAYSASQPLIVGERLSEDPRSHLGGIERDSEVKNTDYFEGAVPVEIAIDKGLFFQKK